MAQTEDLDSIRFLEAGMAAGSHGVWGHGLVPTPGEAELARLRERFRGHHIFHDVRWDREVRYLAYRTASGVQPDTVITDDLAELREQLEQAAPPDLGTGLFLLFAQEPGIGDPDACQWSSGPNPAVPSVDTGLAGSTRRWRSTGTAQRRAACGTLSSPAGLHRAELGGIAIKAALERAALFTANPDDVIIGQVLQADAGQNPARQAAVAAGSPMTVPSITLNKACLSGLDAIALAAELLRVGELDIVVAAGWSP